MLLLLKLTLEQTDFIRLFNFFFCVNLQDLVVGVYMSGLNEIYFLDDQIFTNVISQSYIRPCGILHNFFIYLLVRIFLINEKVDPLQDILNHQSSM